MSARAVTVIKNVALSLALVLSSSACITEPDAADASLLEIGDAMPQFSVVTLDGVVVDTQMLSRRECVIVFFNTTCPDCRRELPIIQARADAEPDVYYICISREEGPAEVAAYWQAEHLTMPVSAQSDRAVYSLFATQGIPRTYTFNATGHLIAQHY